jgi:hypothetical protein
MAQPAVATTPKAELKSFEQPDEVREFPKGRLELIKIGGATIGRAVFEPGWRWATASRARFRCCRAGHDAWVIGNEAAVVVDFQGMIDYARDDRRTS